MALNKFRGEGKDLVSKTEKKKQMFMSHKVINKVDDGMTDGDANNHDALDVHDPRFNYDAIYAKGYKLIKKMGNGAYASVFLCEKLDSPNEQCVLKISIGEERMPDTQNEYNILSNLDFHSIPKVEKIILDNEYFYSIICMVYSNIDHNVLQYIKENGSLDELEVKSAMKELFEALKYIHSLDYAHRDVKPDNVLIKVSAPDSNGHKNVEIALVDYNIAKKAKSHRFNIDEDKKEVDNPGKFRCNYLTHIASQNSQAPELFKSGYYSESVDIWGAGLVMYTLITGEKLKRGDEEIIKDQVQEIPNLTQNGKDLLSQMFSYEGEDRPTADEALNNAWFGDE
jgi:calcium-dependent protein kinase